MSEGGLLPTDFLQELVKPKTAIEGVTPVSYHLAEGERIGEQVNRSWNRLQGCWLNFKKAIADKLPGDSTTTETRERWLLPLFQELDFGRLTIAKPIEVDRRSYAVSHGWGHVPIHLVGSHIDIDMRTPGATGAARMSPHSLVQQALNASDEHLWGIVSNGLSLRLIRDNIALTRMAYVEWDLQAIFDGELYSEFFLLWLVCHQSRFEGARPEQCWLEKWKKIAEDKGLRALENLRPGVEKAIAAIGAGLLMYRANRSLREKLRVGTLSTHEFYQQILRIIYRLLFLFVAEDRNLLHLPLPKDDTATTDVALKERQRYRDFYSVSRLRELRLSRAGSPHPDLWNTFQLVSEKLGSDTGCAELALPALGSFLWAAEPSTPDLKDCLVSNCHFLTAIQALAFVQDGGVRRAVDYKNLGAEELGSVYESLLELHPLVNADTGTFELETFAGSERRTTGSYYTHDSLVQALLDSALEPVIAETTRRKQGAAAAEALLDLKICDPAVGSGHFLIGAAHRLAKHIARARSGEDEPSPEAIRVALREVIGRCLYGVDINPMSAELCKVSLWLEALEPGKPLSFLDHHVRVGNSLLGTTADLIAKGIPDEAFKSIEGDEQAACSALKRLNTRERRGFGELFVREDASNIESLRKTAVAVDELADDTLEAVRRKENAFAAARHNYAYLRAKELGDAWCAAFVIRKTLRHGTTEPIGITQRLLSKLAKGDSLAEELNTEIQRLARDYQFFHWHYEFPDLFGTVGNSGFDVVLSNPPWERVKLQEKEWFAAHGQESIANAPNAAARKRLIQQLQTENAALYKAFLNDLRKAEGASHLLRNSGRYPLSSRGDINLYAVFAEDMRSLLNSSGRMGVVLPTGIATDDTTKLFFQDIVGKNSLRSLFDFENRKGLFPDVHSSMKFCLFTSGSTQAAVAERVLSPAEFAFFCLDVEDLRNPDKRFSLSSADIAVLNPNTRTCPIFRTCRDAEITKAIYRRMPVLLRDGAEEQNPWGIRFATMFHMSNDSGRFRVREQLETDGWQLVGNVFRHGDEEYLPLYEGRMVDYFDHRAASVGVNEENTFRSGVTLETTTEQHALSDYYSLPRYWVSEHETAAAKPDGFPRDWVFGFKDITAATNERTFIGSVIPFSAVGNKVPLLLSNASPKLRAALCANLSSFAFDFIAKQKVGGVTLNFFIVKQLPVLAPATYAEPCAWAGGAGETLRDWLLPRVLELTYTAWDLEPFARDCGWFGPPFVWDGARRFQLRCELDAAFFHLYGLTRDDAAYILDTFQIVKRKDEEKFNGDYRTKRVILEIYGEMTEAIRTSKRYQSRLDPPPSDPRCCHSPQKESICQTRVC
jgi:Eco57I restriction-modification methylase